MQVPTQPTERPTQVTVLAILAWLVGLFELLTALLPMLNALLTWVGSPQAWLATLPGAEATASTGATTALGLLLGGLAIAIGGGGWRQQTWAWPVGVLGLGATALFQLIFLATRSGVWFYALITFLVCVALLILLYRPQVKPALGRP